MRLTNYSKMGRDVKKACSMYAMASSSSREQALTVCAAT